MPEALSQRGREMPDALSQRGREILAADRWMRS
jgi:hypothetical protein